MLDVVGVEPLTTCPLGRKVQQSVIFANVGQLAIVRLCASRRCVGQRPVQVTSAQRRRASALKAMRATKLRKAHAAGDKAQATVPDL